MAAPSTLIIQRGDLPSLVLLLMQPDASKVIAWHPEDRTPSGARRKACAKAIAEARGAGQRIISEVPTAEAQGLQSMGFQHFEARLLLDAAIIAQHFGCTRILSPLIVGPDHAHVSRALERAMIVTELIELEQNVSEMSIDLPLVEWTDRELVELAVDLGAPMSGFWPCAHGGEAPCGACEECRRWIAAFESAGRETDLSRSARGVRV